MRFAGGDVRARLFERAAPRERARASHEQFRVIRHDAIGFVEVPYGLPERLHAHVRRGDVHERRGAILVNLRLVAGVGARDEVDDGQRRSVFLQRLRKRPRLVQLVTLHAQLDVLVQRAHQVVGLDANLATGRDERRRRPESAIVDVVVDARFTVARLRFFLVRRQRLDHDALGVRLGQFALVHGLLRATQHLEHARVTRPLGEIAALVVRERLDDTPQHRVLQEGRHVFLRLEICREHALAKVPRGRFLSVRLHLADLLALLLHERLPVLRALAELAERRALVRRAFGWKEGGRRERRSGGKRATPRRVASDVSGAPNEKRQSARGAMNLRTPRHRRRRRRGDRLPSRG